MNKQPYSLTFSTPMLELFHWINWKFFPTCWCINLAHLSNIRVLPLVLEHLYLRTTKRFFYQCVVHRVCVTLGSQRWWSWAKKARALQIELCRHTVRSDSTNPPKISKFEVPFLNLKCTSFSKYSQTVEGICTLKFQMNKYMHYVL